MGEDPSQIRQDIEQTRERMGDTVEALGHKTDVTGRAKEAVSDKVDAVRSKVSGADSGRRRTAQARRPGSPRRTRSASESAPWRPASSRACWSRPRSVEDEKIGPLADQVKEKVKETGQEAVERGKQVAEAGG